MVPGSMVSMDADGAGDPPRCLDGGVEKRWRRRTASCSPKRQPESPCARHVVSKNCRRRVRTFAFGRLAVVVRLRTPTESRDRQMPTFPPLQHVALTVRDLAVS